MKELLKYIEKIQPDSKKLFSYRDGFFDALEVVKDYINQDIDSNQVQAGVKVNFADDILQEFLDWNKKYPPHKIFNFSEINRISSELSNIMDKAQKHLDDSKISA